MPLSDLYQSLDPADELCDLLSPSHWASGLQQGSVAHL